MLKSLPRVCALATGLLLLTALAAGASHYRSANIEWCAAPEYPDPTPIYFDFTIEVSYREEGRPIGTTIIETFHYGDGTSENVALTIVDRSTEQGWELARGTARHLYGNSNGFASAGLDSCCRIDGTDGQDLNNLSGGPFVVKAAVYVDGELQCSPEINVAPTLWLPGGLGKTYTIPIPATHSQADEKLRCALSNAPAGMSIHPDTCVITWTPTSGNLSKFWTAQVIGQGINIYTDALFSTAIADFLLGLDPKRPGCWLFDTDPGSIEVVVDELESGMASIQVLQASNATVEIQPFDPGTKGALIVIATKVDPNKASRVRLRATDLAGNVTECDPVLTEELRVAGRPVPSVYGDVPPEERFVTVFNGDPGLRMLEVEVNGQRFRMTGLRPGEERTLDVSAAIREGQTSIFSLTSHGKPGGSATVLIWDGNGTEE